MDKVDENTPKWHKTFAIQFNNRAWSLLGQESRNDDENEEMIHAAHASHYHWSKVGEAVNLQRGEWLISHVYAVCGRSEPALHHAGRCMALTEKHNFVDFDLAYAYEAMARAHAAAGNTDEANEFLAKARDAGQAVAKDEDRNLFLQDLENGPWYGVK